MHLIHLLTIIFTFTFTFTKL